METQRSTFSKADTLLPLMNTLERRLNLSGDDYVRVQSFLLFAFNRVDDPEDVLHLFPMLYENASGKGADHLILHPTYTYIVRRFIVQ